MRRTSSIRALLANRVADDKSPVAQVKGTPRIRLAGISKRFPGVQALTDVDFDIRTGTIHGLLGVNGAGKSTLMNVLGGIVRPDSGEVWARGRKVEIRSPRDASALGIRFVHQELSLFPDLDLATNVCVESVPNFGGIVSTKLMRQQARKALDHVGLHEHHTSELAGSLTPGEQQLLEIAKCIVGNVEVLILDEPTSSLTTSEVTSLFVLMRRLAAEGVAIIFLSHRLDEVSDICDDVTVLRDSRVVGRRPVDKLSRSQMVQMMLGRELGSAVPHSQRGDTETILRVRDLTREPAFRDVSFDLHQGEVLGITGLLGSGRTELLRALFGLDRPSHGSVEVGGKPLRLKSPYEAMQTGLALVTEDRRSDGLILDSSIQSNITLAALRHFALYGMMRPREELSAAQRQLERLGIKATSLNQVVRTLSGGGQQRVVLAKWSLTRPKILLMDEPTRGIDVGGKFQLYEIVRSLSSEGVSVIIVSSELDDIFATSDRVLVMRRGEIAGVYPATTPAHDLMLAAAGGE